MGKLLRVRGGDRLKCAWLPPIGVLAQNRPRVVALYFMLSPIGKSFVPAVHDHVFPIPPVPCS